MDDHSELTRKPTPCSLRERLHANRLLRGVGNAAVAVNGLLGQGSPPPLILPPAEERRAPPLPDTDEFAAAFREVRQLIK
ncbi:hypothetical protein [Deinococcus radiotolerans]|uniref:Uncharacterized protein n=1 Tax=Deinococcus radiotolerans TaxID=1309407 RepID=A0ABQ2FNA5_9DEIO|nr:hypothetical protein [Deinococcus radiotolerans]GGL10839.1 hypothetical protein GCM10010844_31870 [Deinococcus radiotolerans]